MEPVTQTVGGQTKVSPTSYISGVGMAVPDKVVGNDHFAAYLETSDEWIRERTGIAERRWAEADESVSDFAEKAARQALADAGLTTDDIDGIIFATVTPDYVFPSSACVLQRKLGIHRGFAFDVNAVCSGFVYALTIADALMAAGQGSNIIVVGAELFSRIIDPKDRTTCVLFGDGAGAVVLSRSAAEAGRQGARNGSLQERHAYEGGKRGIYGSELCADGQYGDILCLTAGTASPVTPESLREGKHFVQMNGREVFKLAVRNLVEVSERLLAKSGFSVADVDFFISHQANKRILTSMGERLGVAESKVLSNVERYGNTSAASLPILLAEAAQSGVLKAGDLVLLSAVGGGLTWGAMLLRW